MLLLTSIRQFIREQVLKFECANALLNFPPLCACDRVHVEYLNKPDLWQNSAKLDTLSTTSKVRLTLYSSNDSPFRIPIS